jgi:LDH2 family malate/lactate/ureidoglycolate dehydrogenase
MKLPIPELQRLCLSSLQKIGYSEEHAQLISKVLLYAELRGNNQGLIKLVSGGLNKNANQRELRVIFESPVSAKLDGGNQSGMVVVSHAVNLALEKCAKSGISIVGVSGYASATGALGYWAREITSKGYIGIVMSQCSEMVAPHGSYEPIYGTNPIAIGIPTIPRAQILDMATSAFAYYGIKIAEQNGEAIPGDVAYDSNGFPTTNPTEALRGAIRSFDRSYKGSHLALMVELLSGALTGASMENKLASENWGSLVLAIDPNIFGAREEFLVNAQTMCDRVKHAAKLPNQKGDIYLPGERGDELEAAHLKEGCLEISDRLFSQLTELAR